MYTHTHTHIYIEHNFTCILVYVHGSWVPRLALALVKADSPTEPVEVATTS